MDWQTILLAIIGGLLGGSGGAAIVAAIANRAPTAASADKTGAEAEQIRAQTEISLADLYRKDLAEVRLELGRVGNNQANNVDHIARLEAARLTDAKRIADLEAKNGEWERNCKEMQAQLSTLQSERQEWKDGIDSLIAQLRELEIKPRWVRKGTEPLK